MYSYTILCTLTLETVRESAHVLTTFEAVGPLMQWWFRRIVVEIQLSRCEPVVKQSKSFSPNMWLDAHMLRKRYYLDTYFAQIKTERRWKVL